jgi:hypothetical protein
MNILMIFLVIWLSIVPISSYKTVFSDGYNQSKLFYETVVPYANLSMKINQSFIVGPGQNLFTEINDPSKTLYVGNTMNRQAFDTQFVLDIEKVIGINRERVYVTHVSKGKGHFSWEASTVIVQFIFLERNDSSSITLLDAIAKLTNFIQVNTSALYLQTNVTKDVDSTYGLVIRTWDITLKLAYTLNVIGENAIRQGYFINLGGLGTCDSDDRLQYLQYCEFEDYFEQDIAQALNISLYRVHIMFIKSAALDSVYVSFRIFPPMRGSKEDSITSAIQNLSRQLKHLHSELYRGNVTIRTDPVYGISNDYTSLRTFAPLFTYNHYQLDDLLLAYPERVTLYGSYDRCKANRRCNWGVIHRNQSNHVDYYHQLFDNGQLLPIQLFIDFEDWRIGGRGWSAVYSEDQTFNHPAGSHFSPFHQTVLGPVYPSYRSESNQGLVLDHHSHIQQVLKQSALVSYLQGQHQWLEANQETARMDSVRRSRRDVVNYFVSEISNTSQWLKNEIDELKALNLSQCVHRDCQLIFNTSSLRLEGVINATGAIRTTDSGTEIAVYTFDSIYLGPEVEVIVVGQRALGLASRSTVIINTTIEAQPGTLGGMPGGGSVGRRYPEDVLIDDPEPILISDLSNSTRFSNNINGLGSGSLLVTTFTLQTSAAHIPEIQRISTSAAMAQSLAGGFLIHYQNYSTSIIPYDASASLLKKVMESDLNLPTGINRAGAMAGIGIVNVSRRVVSDEDAYAWTITFTTAIGNISSLRLTSYLQGINASVKVDTIQQGNDLHGRYRIHIGNINQSTALISTSASAAQLAHALITIPKITSVHVTRSDPSSGGCDDGLCDNGPSPGHGYVWTCIFTTSDFDLNVSPTSPTSLLAGRPSISLPLELVDVNLNGLGATISIKKGTIDSPDDDASRLLVKESFSLSYGGHGASYGGLGGHGYLDEQSMIYNNDALDDLLGGSGGAMRYGSPFEFNKYGRLPTGRGGDGGGAIEIVAANDVIIGSYGKVLMQGGHGEEASEGGGGGGSGGAILLSAGGLLRVDGILDVRGGDGGFGGYRDAARYAGGGGSGGRIALYAQSVSIAHPNQTLSNSALVGGRCGRRVIAASSTLTNYTLLHMNLTLASYLPLTDRTWSFLGMQFLRERDTSSVRLTGLQAEAISTYQHNYTYLAFIAISAIWMNDISSSSFVSEFLEERIHQSIAGVVLVDALVLKMEPALNTSSSSTSYPTDCTNHGHNGSFFSQSPLSATLTISSANEGAEQTSRALRIISSATARSSNPPESTISPTIAFLASRPTRMTVYVRMNSSNTSLNGGVLISYLSHREAELNTSSVIGIYIGTTIMYGANFNSAVDEDIYLKQFVTIDYSPRPDRWYKFDIFLEWSSSYAGGSYRIAVDDTTVTSQQPFQAHSLDAIRIRLTQNVDILVDEIYVGFDNTMGFTCPSSNRTGTISSQPIQKSWSYTEIHGGNNQGYTEYTRMQRHYNHLSTVSTVPLDGQGSIRVNQDLKLQFPNGDYLPTNNKLHAGALVYIQNSLRSGKTPTGRSSTRASSTGFWYQPPDGNVPGGAGDGRHFWYTEYTHRSSLSSSLNGGVAACSSQDLTTWRFEGIVFHYTNLSDMIYGTAGPFELERPSVRYNPNTNAYVMWAVLDNQNRSLAMNAIMSSPYEDGPFFFRRSFYPDGNRTRDQTLFHTNTSNAVVLLGRTYYLTIEYLMPEAIMQPVWESVKERGTGKINYRANYHRAWYEIGYDNYNDIYLQRWRHESEAWNISCIHRVTGVARNIPYGTYTSSDRICQEPDEYKVVYGQGNPVITSRFVSPLDYNLSWWRPTSVPSVKSQPWANNYQDGVCGIRDFTDGFDTLDPDLDSFTPADHSNCSNIADNPIFTTVQDKLIGILRIVTTRRAKFIAISELTLDYMDTTGRLESIEGELTSGRLISLITDLGQFGFDAGEMIQSTFFPPGRVAEFDTAWDYQIRYSQYVVNYNDRASYSIACVLDGVCPVNFRDQITKGNI